MQPGSTARAPPASSPAADSRRRPGDRCTARHGRTVPPVDTPRVHLLRRPMQRTKQHHPILRSQLFLTHRTHPHRPAPPTLKNDDSRRRSHVRRRTAERPVKGPRSDSDEDTGSPLTGPARMCKRLTPQPNLPPTVDDTTLTPMRARDHATPLPTNTGTSGEVYRHGRPVQWGFTCFTCNTTGPGYPDRQQALQRLASHRALRHAIAPRTDDTTPVRAQLTSGTEATA